MGSLVTFPQMESQVKVREAQLAKAASVSLPQSKTDNYPLGSILYMKTGKGLKNWVGNKNPFLSSVLGPQYNLQADGSYIQAADNVPVDVIGGRKMLRTCGAVTNLLPSGAQDFAASWSKVFSNVSLESGWYKVTETTDSQSHSVTSPSIAPVAGTTYTARVHIKSAERGFAFVGVFGAATIFVSINLSTGAVSVATGSPVSYSAEAADGGWIVCVTAVLPITTSTLLDVRSSLNGVWANRSYPGVLGSGILVRNPQLTASAYPLPYTPPGTTMPASHATTTNGPWFGLPQYDDAENTKVNKVWAALTGSPMTLAWRGMMGVGSGDLANATTLKIVSVSNTADMLYARKASSGETILSVSHDGTTYNTSTTVPGQNRNVGFLAFTQVNSDGTVFRAGYYIIGVSSNIVWGNWASYDGSYSPSTLYKLMFGMNNIYPMWHDTIALWDKQIDDATLLKEMLK